MAKQPEGPISQTSSTQRSLTERVEELERRTDALATALLTVTQLVLDPPEEA